MIITFSPTRRDETLTLVKTGDVLNVNGTDFDFGPLLEGAELPLGGIGDKHWFCGPARRIGGVVHLHMMLPHGGAAPYETRFPAPLTIAGDGPVVLPAHSI